jgi:hypothetical protein
VAIRIREKHLLRVSKTTAELARFYDNYDDTAAEMLNDECTLSVDGPFSIAGAAQESLSFGDISQVQWVWVEADGDFVVSVDGGAGVAVKARNTGSGTTKLARWGGTIQPTTSIEITNSDATATLSGIYWMAGDLA